MEHSEGPSGPYKMQTFARLTGLSPTILRAWERRHGLLEPVRRESGHRLYTEDDLKVIRRVLQLIQEGRAIGEIAAAGRSALLAERTDAEFDGLIGTARGVLESSAPSVPDASLRVEQLGLEQPVLEQPGTSVLPMADAPGGPNRADAPNVLHALRFQVVDAARTLDDESLSRTLDRAFSMFSVESVLARVIQPAAYEIGERWARGQITIAGEHMVSSMLAARIERLREVALRPETHAPIVTCACLPGEQHELGLLVIALHLAHAGFRVSYLGRDLPISDIERAAERIQATAVCLSVRRTAIVERCRAQLKKLASSWAGRIEVHLGGVDSPERFDDLLEAGVSVWSPRANPQNLIATIHRQSRSFQASEKLPTRDVH